MGDLDPCLIHDSFGPSKPKTQQHLDQFNCFYTAHCRLSLYSVPSPLKIDHSYGGIWTPSNTWFLGPARVLNPNGISFGSAVFARLTAVTD